MFSYYVFCYSKKEEKVVALVKASTKKIAEDTAEMFDKVEHEGEKIYSTLVEEIEVEIPKKKEEEKVIE